MIKTLLKLSLILSILSTSIYADSLWESRQTEFYNVPRKRIGVGDVITVRITESTSAVQEASTRTSKESDMGTNFLSSWDQVANILGSETIRKQYELGMSGDDNYRGAGQTSRKTKVQGTLACLVTEILESGNLFIVGEKKVKVNNEVETVRISGVIRPSDILGDNSIESKFVAKKEISVNGVGVVAAKQNPGVLTKLFNWFF